MNYLTQIDPIGEEKEYCINCNTPSKKKYCSNQCKREYNE